MVNKHSLTCVVEPSRKHRGVHWVATMNFHSKYATSCALEFGTLPQYAFLAAFKYGCWIERHRFRGIDHINVLQRQTEPRFMKKYLLRLARWLFPERQHDEHELVVHLTAQDPPGFRAWSLMTGEGSRIVNGVGRTEQEAIFDVLQRHPRVCFQDSFSKIVVIIIDRGVYDDRT